MADRLRDSDQYENARIAGWESSDGEYHTVYNDDGKKIGRAPSDHSLETANRVVIQHGDDYYTVGPLTPDYEIDEAIDEITDYYGED